MTAIRLSPVRYPALVKLAAGRPLADVEVVIKLTYPSLHGQKEFRLRPGVVDADAVELFGFAQSHRLAAAMHERTGWPFALVEQHVDGVWKWAHVGVVTSAGRMLDIHGLREVAEVERQTSNTYGPLARVRVLDTLEDLRDVTAPNPHLADWTADIDAAVGVEMVALLAETLIAKAKAEGQEETRPVTATRSVKDTARHEARALLAAAADERHFYRPIWADGSHATRLCEASEATAMYAAQAATANALLAVVGELAELRAEVRQAAAVREDLAAIAGAVRELTAAMSPLTTIAESVDGLSDQVEAVRDEVEDGLAAVADTMTLLFDRRPRWWSRLWWLGRRRAAMKGPGAAEVRKAPSAGAAPTTQLGDIFTRAAELLDREGWDARGISGRDVMMAVSQVTMSSPGSPYDQDLCTQAWDTIVAHLDGQPLTEWQRELSRTQGQVVAMLREVAAKVTVSELPSDAGEGDR